jgi:hypothetical protein
MNRNFLIFGAFLILLGFGTGYYFLAFFGFLLLVGAFRSGASRPAPRLPTPPREERRRIIPPPPKTEEHPHSTPAVASLVPPSSPPTPNYTPSLFPNSMFPAMAGPSPQVHTSDKASANQGSRDELVEVGSILALLRLALG